MEVEEGAAAGTAAAAAGGGIGLEGEGGRAGGSASAAAAGGGGGSVLLMERLLDPLNPTTVDPETGKTQSGPDLDAVTKLWLERRRRESHISPPCLASCQPVLLVRKGRAQPQMVC